MAKELQLEIDADILKNLVIRTRINECPWHQLTEQEAIEKIQKQFGISDPIVCKQLFNEIKEQEALVVTESYSKAKTTSLNEKLHLFKYEGLLQQHRR